MRRTVDIVRPVFSRLHVFDEEQFFSYWIELETKISAWDFKVSSARSTHVTRILTLIDSLFVKQLATENVLTVNSLTVRGLLTNLERTSTLQDLLQTLIVAVGNKKRQGNLSVHFRERDFNPFEPEDFVTISFDKTRALRVGPFSEELVTFQLLETLRVLIDREAN
jgi:hypothetical protein